MPATSYEKQVRDRVLQLRGLWTQLANDADLTIQWVSNFANDKSSDYGIRRIEALDKAIDTRISG